MDTTCTFTGGRDYAVIISSLCTDKQKLYEIATAAKHLFSKGADLVISRSEREAGVRVVQGKKINGIYYEVTDRVTNKTHDLLVIEV